MEVKLLTSVEKEGGTDEGGGDGPLFSLPNGLLRGETRVRRRQRAEGGGRGRGRGGAGGDSSHPMILLLLLFAMLRSKGSFFEGRGQRARYPSAADRATRFHSPKSRINKFSASD